MLLYKQNILSTHLWADIVWVDILVITLDRQNEQTDSCYGVLKVSYTDQ